jgi:hypothetical protein
MSKLESYEWESSKQTTYQLQKLLKAVLQTKETAGSWINDKNIQKLQAKYPKCDIQKIKQCEYIPWINDIENGFNNIIKILEYKNDFDFGKLWKCEYIPWINDIENGFNNIIKILEYKNDFDFGKLWKCKNIPWINDQQNGFNNIIKILEYKNDFDFGRLWRWSVIPWINDQQNGFNNIIKILEYKNDFDFGKLYWCEYIPRINDQQNGFNNIIKILEYKNDFDFESIQLNWDISWINDQQNGFNNVCTILKYKNDFDFKWLYGYEDISWINDQQNGFNNIIKILEYKSDFDFKWLYWCKYIPWINNQQNGFNNIIKILEYKSDFDFDKLWWWAGISRITDKEKWLNNVFTILKYKSDFDFGWLSWDIPWINDQQNGFNNIIKILEYKNDFDFKWLEKCKNIARITNKNTWFNAVFTILEFNKNFDFGQFGWWTQDNKWYRIDKNNTITDVKLEHIATFANIRKINTIRTNNNWNTSNCDWWIYELIEKQNFNLSYLRQHIELRDYDISKVVWYKLDTDEIKEIITKKQDNIELLSYIALWYKYKSAEILKWLSENHKNTVLLRTCRLTVGQLTKQQLESDYKVLKEQKNIQDDIWTELSSIFDSMKSGFGSYPLSTMYSIAVAIHRTKTKNETIAQAFDRIMTQREVFEKMNLIDHQTTIYCATYQHWETNKESFLWSVDDYFNPKIEYDIASIYDATIDQRSYSTRGTKTALDWLSQNTDIKTTLVIKGHGTPQKINLTTMGRNITSTDDPQTYITTQDMLTMYKTRYQKIKNQPIADDWIIFTACYSYDFVVNFYELWRKDPWCKENKILPPKCIVSANKNNASLKITSSARNYFANQAKQQHMKSTAWFTGKDILTRIEPYNFILQHEKDNDTYNDTWIFVPDEKFWNEKNGGNGSNGEIGMTRNNKDNEDYLDNSAKVVA